MVRLSLSHRGTCARVRYFSRHQLSKRWIGRLNIRLWQIKMISSIFGCTYTRTTGRVRMREIVHHQRNHPSIGFMETEVRSHDDNLCVTTRLHSLCSIDSIISTISVCLAVFEWKKWKKWKHRVVNTVQNDFFCGFRRSTPPSSSDPRSHNERPVVLESPWTNQNYLLCFRLTHNFVFDTHSLAFIADFLIVISWCCCWCWSEMTLAWRDCSTWTIEPTTSTETKNNNRSSSSAIIIIEHFAAVAMAKSFRWCEVCAT